MKNILENFEIIKISGMLQGNCLFNALAEGINSDESAKQIRDNLGEWIINNKGKLINKISISNLIKNGYKISVENYVLKLKDRQWGTTVDIIAFFYQYMVNIIVYEQINKTQFKDILSFIDKNNEKNVYLLHSKNEWGEHYNLLKMINQ